VITRESYEPTDDWLEQTNKELSNQDVPHKQRPWQAWMAWSKYAGVSTSLGDEDVKKIFDWFEKNSKAGAQYIGPVYTGSFYYDACFWPIRIPVVCGQVKLDAVKSLGTMPDSIKLRLTRDRNAFINFAALWADCLDYGMGIEEADKNSGVSVFWQELLRSGDQQLNATVTLLHEDNPNPKASEAARMATEMFLKAFLALKVGLTEEMAKDEIGHDLVKCLDRCLAFDALSDLQIIRADLSGFPAIAERYKGLDKTSAELWKGYSVAQFVGTYVVRIITGRDARKTIRVG